MRGERTTPIRPEDGTIGDGSESEELASSAPRPRTHALEMQVITGTSLTMTAGGRPIPPAVETIRRGGRPTRRLTCRPVAWTRVAGAGGADSGRTVALPARSGAAVKGGAADSCGCAATAVVSHPQGILPLRESASARTRGGSRGRPCGPGRLRRFLAPRAARLPRGHTNCSARLYPRVGDSGARPAADALPARDLLQHLEVPDRNHGERGWSR